jgi:hypothetical protein
MVTGTEVAVAKLTWEGFAALWRSLTDLRQSKSLEAQMKAAWHELLKADKGDESVIEAALLAARNSHVASPDVLRLENLHRTARRAKKAAVSKKKSAPKKPAAKKRAAKKTVTKART